MSPRIPRPFLRPLYAQFNSFTPLRVPFSGSSRALADNATTSLINTLTTVKSSRSPQTPILSKPQGQSTGSASTSNSSTDVLVQTLRRAMPPRALATARADDRSANTALKQRVRQVEGQATRNWRDGDVYAPHDLSPVEMQKARQARLSARSNNMAPANTRKKGGKDVLDDLGIDPLKEYKNFAMMSEFMTEMGRIRHSRDTGLRPVNQRRMAKAVRRAIGIGIMPSVHRHPELTDERMRLRGR